jgi:hypothetical protein
MQAKKSALAESALAGADPMAHTSAAASLNMVTQKKAPAPQARDAGAPRISIGGTGIAGPVRVPLPLARRQIGIDAEAK